MSDRRRDDLIFFGMLGLLAVIVFVVLFAAEMRGYEKGQIDAINGEIKYHLIEQPDQTVVWERVEE